jgi:hypothetical protein
MKDRDIDLISSVDGSTNGGVPPKKNPLSVAAIGLARIEAILAGKRRRTKATTIRSSMMLLRVQRRASALRCQRRTVAAQTIRLTHRSRGSSRANAAINARSAGRNRGRDTCRRSTATSCRSWGQQRLA